MFENVITSEVRVTITAMIFDFAHSGALVLQRSDPW